MKPHLNSRDADFYLHLYQIAHAHKYHCPKPVRLLSSRSMNYTLRNQRKCQKRRKKKPWIRPLIRIGTKIECAPPWPTLHPSSRFPGNPSNNLWVILPTIRQTNQFPKWLNVSVAGEHLWQSLHSVISSRTRQTVRSSSSALILGFIWSRSDTQRIHKVYPRENSCYLTHVPQMHHLITPAPHMVCYTHPNTSHKHTGDVLRSMCWCIHMCRMYAAAQLCCTHTHTHPTKQSHSVHSSVNT